VKNAEKNAVFTAKKRENRLLFKVRVYKVGGRGQFCSGTGDSIRETVQGIPYVLNKRMLVIRK
jgi:hypothetical protein